MSRYRLLLLPLALACGDDTSNGAMELRTDGALQTFDSTEVVMTATSSVVTLTATGRNNPIPGVADTGSTTQLVVAFDRAALSALDAPVTLDIDGTTTFDFGTEDGTSPFQWRGAPTSVTLVWFEIACACIGFETGAQGIEGSVRFDTLTDSTIAGSLTVTATGTVPNVGSSGTLYQVDVDFDRSGL